MASTKQWSFGKVFWGIMFILLVISVGSGPWHLDVARLAVVGMVVAWILFDKSRISRRVLLILEVACFITFMGVGIFAHNAYLVIGGLAFLVLIALVALEVRLGRKIEAAAAKGDVNRKES